ncbi:MAG TPA: hypothetical protein DCO70_02760 [Verrucomicrobiales bacterium]|nr:hypothetical protein [Verrucomicrobiales bacterium]|tara:strand:+ start:697 stop:1818 length:1122 start_codon:yes stop_codon:yes gene_type:complete
MPEQELNEKTKKVLVNLANAMVDQGAAKVLVEPQQNADGFWFGSGNIIESKPGRYLLCGRYRNHGDSRTGTDTGARGLEFALFEGSSPTGPFTKMRSFSKQDLSRSDAPVVSIEGGKLFAGPGGLEMIVSTEKGVAYPETLATFQKPGTGVWSIDRISADSIKSLDIATLTEVQSSSKGATLHIKDPVVFESPTGGTALMFCSHPFSWSSSNTGLALRDEGGDVAFTLQSYSVLERGATWDVACTRVTDRLAVPQVGLMAELPPLSLYFYDGAECLRSLDENAKAVNRPRGYSCEELGGLAWGWDSQFPRMQRLSDDFPLFVSPYGTGCSRYVSTLKTQGGIMATWQQSQPDRSQPLVGNFLDNLAVESQLSG